MNLWEYVTKHRELPKGFPVPEATLDFINGKRDQSTFLAIGIAVAELAHGNVLAAVAAKGQADAIEQLLKKINV